jgi:hypothetical protein
MKILSVLRGAYPAFYRDTSRQEAEAIVNLWAEMFREDDYQLVAAAVKSLIVADSKGFPPVIGQVKEYIRKLTAPQEMTEQEAWALVSKAIRNGTWGAKEEFAALPPQIQRIVGSPTQLSDWAKMDSDSVHSVVASNFQRSYRAKAKADKEFAALPSEVRAAIGGLSNMMRLEADNEKRDLGDW